jgi:ABC-type uncharacterized transport system ATPase subunit
VVLISHKLTEVFAVADRYTVLRGGAVAGRGDIAGTTAGHLVELMVGESLTPRRERTPASPGASTLVVTELSTGSLEDVSLDVRAGEIVGIAGVAGSGQSELVEAVLGIRPATAGTIEVGGAPLEPCTPYGFFAAGGALIPEDRHRVAVIGGMTLGENINLRALRQAPLARHGRIDPRAARERARRLMAEYEVRAAGENQLMARLSGGNQQKAVLARELSTEPSLVIAVQPVRGLDVRATEFVYRRLTEHRDRGGAVLLISMDLDEVLALSDRIAVLAHGRVRGVLEASEATRAKIGALMVAA